MNRHGFFVVALLFSVGATFTTMPSRADTTVTFASGSEGWTGGGSIDASVGNAAPAWRLGPAMVDFFYFGTSTNTAFLGDYSRSPRVEIGFDTSAQTVTESGALLVQLFDSGDGTPYDWASVWRYADYVRESADSQWITYSVAIDDTSAGEIPSGWYGTSGVNSTGLPPGRTFADVLAGVNAVRISSLPPGWFVGDGSLHDVTLDNLFIRSLPRLGDANRDGAVDRQDAAIVASHFGVASGATFDDGDFDHDGGVGLVDLAILQRHLDPEFTSPGGSAAVPEPAAIQLAIAAAVALLACPKVRKRRETRASRMSE